MSNIITNNDRTSAKALVELNNNDIAHMAPAVFATEAAADVTERYTFVSTESVLPVLRDSGFVVTGASMGKKRGVHGRHRLELFHQNHIAGLRKGELHEVPRIILENSHDRSRRLVMMMGYFRLVCSNGMVVASGLNGQLRALHLKLDVVAITQMVKDLARMLDAADASVSVMKARKLSNPEQSVLANYALEARYRGWDHFPLEAKSLLTVRRDADKANDAWSVFNRIQENVVRGGLTTARGRKSRGLASFHADIEVNKRLWAGAEAVATGGIAALQKLRKALAATQAAE